MDYLLKGKDGNWKWFPSFFVLLYMVGSTIWKMYRNMQNLPFPNYGKIMKTAKLIKWEKLEISRIYQNKENWKNW